MAAAPHGNSELIILHCEGSPAMAQQQMLRADPRKQLLYCWRKLMTLEGRKSENFSYMFFNVLGHFFGRQVVGISTKRIFNFLCYQLQAGQYVKNKSHHWYSNIPQEYNKT